MFLNKHTFGTYIKTSTLKALNLTRNPEDDHKDFQLKLNTKNPK